ncbi:MAG TPA: ribosome small subunit-dependent GTPase A [Candidatus Eubacterium faecipullorum]|uniref:Small ribosomal subunit biogenesis GTPase RsgA n=1 Tax=Candidatus Eubacterium faecipullorum TaxID=2838571 RepID=A0A9D1RCN2_9FIRM|nr:ribosome small subunit-dependent GTPase A [Candidatus Eubacterium faecipullorum]
MITGKIVKGIGGFYYVETADTVYECKARGNFRNKKLTPLVGDNAVISVNENSENRIEEILPRKNSLVRPPLANIDQLFAVSSLVDPDINPFNLDKMIAVAEYKGIEPVIVLTKIDLYGDYSKYKELYEKAGFKVIACNNLNGEGAEKVFPLLKEKTSAFSGNTGVGKSSLLNALSSSLNLKTGETSKKLGRGKHTTRHCELFKVGGGYVADTPGFSSYDFENGEVILKDELFDCFREFRPYFAKCKFSTCAHINEKGCAICDAVEHGHIARSRHESYVRMYNDVKNIKEWELTK